MHSVKRATSVSVTELQLKDRYFFWISRDDKLIHNNFGLLGTFQTIIVIQFVTIIVEKSF